MLSWLAVGVITRPALFLALDSTELDLEVFSSTGEQQTSGTPGRQLVSSVDTKVFNLSRYWLYSSTSLCPAPSTQSGSTALGHRS